MVARIVLDPEVLSGKPVVRGTRISVELVLEHLANGWNSSELLEAYPRLTPEDIRACLAYAGEILHADRV
jgi:uncharacterized protein (DUF433 family)